MENEPPDGSAADDGPASPVPSPRLAVRVSVAALLGLVILLLVIPASRRAIVDGFDYAKDSFHSLSDCRYFFDRAVGYSEAGRDNLAVRTFLRITLRLDTVSIENHKYQKQALFNAGVLLYTRGQNLPSSAAGLRSGLFDRASGLWDRYLSLNDNDRASGLATSLDEANARQIIEARAYIDSLDETPRNPRAKYFKDLGQKAYYNHDLKLALDYYLKAISLDPTYDTAYNNAGAMHFYIGEEKFKEFSAAKPDRRTRTAFSNAAVSNFRDSVRFWEKAVLLDPKANKELFLSMAGVYQQYLGDTARAVQCLREHLRLNPDDPQRDNIRQLIKDTEGH